MTYGAISNSLTYMKLKPQKERVEKENFEKTMGKSFHFLMFILLFDFLKRGRE